MIKNYNKTGDGTREQSAGSGAIGSARYAPRAAVFLIAVMITLSSAMGNSLTVRSPEVELLKLQVFAKHSIHAARSDYEGPTAAVEDVDLSDFAIDGDLTSGGHISFQNGQVKGLMTSPDTRAVRVFSSGIGSIRQDAMGLASVKLDLWAARLSALSRTSRFETATAADGNQEFRAFVKHAVEVVDLDGDLLGVGGNGESRIVLSGGRDGLLLVRVHGRSVHLRHVGFSVEGGLDPSQIVFFFPEATDLEISESGGARADNGTTWNIPGSFIAPDASLKFSASTVTGQLFAGSIASMPGLPSGQVNRLPFPIKDQINQIKEGFISSTLLKMIDENRLAHLEDSEHDSEETTGCQIICARTDASRSDSQPTH